MKRLIPAFVVLIAVAAGATALSAKPLSQIIREVGLTPDDFKMLSAAGESLYATASPRKGKVATWSNPESKSRGTARLAAMRDGCAYVQHFVFPKGAEKSKEIRTRFCRNASGKWVLAP